MFSIFPLASPVKINFNLVVRAVACDSAACIESVPHQFIVSVHDYISFGVVQAKEAKTKQQQQQQQSPSRFWSICLPWRYSSFIEHSTSTTLLLCRDFVLRGDLVMQQYDCVWLIWPFVEPEQQKGKQSRMPKGQPEKKRLSPGHQLRGMLAAY